MKEDGKGRNVVSSLFKSCPTHTLMLFTEEVEGGMCLNSFLDF
jgi:hypothetical protein